MTKIDKLTDACITMPQLVKTDLFRVPFFIRDKLTDGCYYYATFSIDMLHFIGVSNEQRIQYNYNFDANV